MPWGSANAHGASAFIGASASGVSTISGVDILSGTGTFIGTRALGGLCTGAFISIGALVALGAGAFIGAEPIRYTSICNGDVTRAAHMDISHPWGWNWPCSLTGPSNGDAGCGLWVPTVARYEAIINPSHDQRCSEI